MYANLIRILNQNDARDRVTIGFYGIQKENECSIMDAIQATNIQKLNDEFKLAAKRINRTPPEVVVSFFLIPDWQSGMNFESNEYKSAKAKFFKQVTQQFDLSDIRVEDFLNKESLTIEEKEFLRGLENLGSNADMIKMHAIICPENQNRRHLQLDSNTKIYNYQDLYNQTFGNATQLDRINASYYDRYLSYVSAHNKIVYTTPNSQTPVGKISLAMTLRKVHLAYCQSHRERNLSTDPEIRRIKNDKNPVYTKGYNPALNLFGLTQRRQLGKKIIYPVKFSKPEFQLTRNIATAVNMSWTKVDLKDSLKKLQDLSPIEAGDTSWNFACFENAVKKFTKPLIDHVDDLSQESKEYQDLINITNPMEKELIKKFIEHVRDKHPKYLKELLNVFIPGERTDQLVQSLFNCSPGDLLSVLENESTHTTSPSRFYC